MKAVSFRIFLIVLMIISSFYLGFSQCKKLDDKTDKETGIRIRGGAVTSTNFYNLLIQKTTQRDGSSQYVCTLIAGANEMFADSTLEKRPDASMILGNGESLLVKYSIPLNEPLGYKNSIGVQFFPTKEELGSIFENSIQSLEFDDIVSARFNDKNQERIKLIIQCLEE